ALEGEFELALFELLARRQVTERLPVPAIPQLHGAAAVLALGDGALEVAVIERMVFHFDGEALVGRRERGASRHRPGLEHSVELEPQVIVQAPGGMLLNDEAQTSRGAHWQRAARFA